MAREFMLHTCFLSGSLEFCYVLCRACLWNQHPVEILGIMSLVGFPGQKHHTLFAAFSLLGEEHILCDP